jgi:hypothetical protein
MAPPLYNDLGKQARDLFSKGYSFGFIKVDTVTKSGDIELKTVADHNIATSKLFGSADVKYKIPDLGLTLLERWNTDNLLNTEITFEDRFARGLKFGLDASVAPNVGKRSAKIKSEYRQESFAVNSDLIVDSTGGPVFHCGAVFQYKPWLFGYSTSFDLSKSKLTNSNVAIGYVNESFAFHTFANDNKEFGGTALHRVNEEMELGASVGWTTGEQATRFMLASKYQHDENTILRAKIGSNSLLAAAATFTLKPGLKATLSTQVNLTSVNNSGHKIGFGLEYDSSA